MGGKRTIEPCDKIHSEARGCAVKRIISRVCLLTCYACKDLKSKSELQIIREKFEAHKDGKEGSDLRIKYEDTVVW